MGDGVAIVGVGHAGFAPITAGLSYKEQTFEAALRAYDDAGIDPRRDVDSFVAVSEDFWEGTSIFDEYVPDQLGAALRPVHTVASDGLYAMATAVMLIRSGAAGIVVVEGHSKVSDVVTLGHIHQFAMDPVLNRPLDVSPLAVAGLEMASFLEATGATEEQCALVVEKNRGNALDNPVAAYPTAVTAEDVADSDPLWWPLKRLEVADRADGAVVLVLAEERIARELTDAPVWVAGVGWSSGSPTLESRTWGEVEYVRDAGDRAYEMAGVATPSRDIDIAEVDDLYSYRELMSLEALRLAPPEQAARLLEEGYFGRDGEIPVNVSGGSLGQGNLFEANGLAKAMECVLQLRGEAGERQLDNVGVAVAQSWRGIPTTSAAVAVLASDEAVA